MPSTHSPGRRAKAAASAILTAAAVVATATACSTGPHPTGVATAGANGPAATTSRSAASAAAFDQDFIDFAHCMRAHGIANFADPAQRPGHSGLSLEFPQGLDVTTGTGKAANDACQHFIQPVIDMKNSSAAALLTPTRLQGLLAYSRCMRVHQIPLLDPDPHDGHISFGTVPGLSAPPQGRQDALFAAADSACRSLLPAGVADDGTGPP